MENTHFLDIHSLLTFIAIPLLSFTLFVLSYIPVLRAKYTNSRIINLLSKDIFYFLTLTSLTFIFQLTHILQNYQVSHPDEPAMVVQAYTLLKDPVFFRSVEGGTNGPFNSYVLSALLAIGFPYNYTTARIACFILSVLCVWFLYRAICVLGYSKFARLGILPTALFFAYQQDYELFQYTSHHMPIFVVSVCIWLIARTAKLDVMRNAIYAGLVLGVVPFTKLQYALIGVFLGAVLVITVYFRLVDSFAIRMRKIFLVILSGLVIPLILAIIFFTTGVLDDAYMRYIVSNVFYVSVGPVPLYEALTRFFQDYSFWGTRGFKLYFRSGFLIFTLITPIILFYFKKADPKACLVIFFSWALLAVSMYSACAPMRPFPHYVLVCVPAVGFLLGISLSVLSEIFPAINTSNFLSIVVFASCTWSFKSDLLERFEKRFPPEDTMVAGTIHPVSKEAIKFAGKGDSLAIWGYRPSIFLETGLYQATRENVSYYQINPNPFQKYYRSMFLSDIKRNQPEIFMDVVGKSNWDYYDPGVNGLHTFPKLLRYIQDNYLEVGNIEQIRLFVRKDRYNDRVKNNPELMPYAAFPVSPVKAESKRLISNDPAKAITSVHAPALLELPLPADTHSVNFSAELSANCPVATNDGIMLTYGIKSGKKITWLNYSNLIKPNTGNENNKLINVELPSSQEKERTIIMILNPIANEHCDLLHFSNFKFQNN